MTLEPKNAMSEELRWHLHRIKNPRSVDDRRLAYVYASVELCLKRLWADRTYEIDCWKQKHPRL